VLSQSYPNPFDTEAAEREYIEILCETGGRSPHSVPCHSVEYISISVWLQTQKEAQLAENTSLFWKLTLMSGDRETWSQ